MSENLIQRSPEWHAARLGSLGASCLHEVVARTKTGFAASRANRMAALLLERLTGNPEDPWNGKQLPFAVQHGIDMEPKARDYYAFTRDVDVMEVGLIKHPTIVGTHASPDGLIGAAGMLEIKCPQPGEHLRILMERTIPEKHLIQMQWQMACAERQWCDYLSYNLSFPDRLIAFSQRIMRDEARIKELESAVIAFLDELERSLARLSLVSAA